MSLPYYDKEAVVRAARGSWLDIFQAAGLHIPQKKEGKKLVGPCPICSTGGDKFNFDDKGGDGTWIYNTPCGCHSIRAGKGLKLLQLGGMTFPESTAFVGQFCNVSPENNPARKTKKLPYKEEKKAALARLTDNQKTVFSDHLDVSETLLSQLHNEGTLAERYGKPLWIWPGTFQIDNSYDARAKEKYGKRPFDAGRHVTGFWRQHLITKDTETLFMSEGCKDGVAVLESGLESNKSVVLAAYSENIFGSHYTKATLQAFRDKKIILLLDKDAVEKRSRHIKAAAELYALGAKEVSFFSWQGITDVSEKADMHDLFIKLGKKEFCELFQNQIVTIDKSEILPRSEEELAESKRKDNDPLLLSAQLSDDGNAECVKARHPDKYAQNEAFGWIVYDGTKWTREGAENILEQDIKETLKARCRAGLQAGRSDLVKYALPNRSRVEGCKYFVRMDSYVNERIFDSKPDVLNCKNGTVNLKTGEIQPHRSSDYLTHCIEINYNPDADYLDWESWLTDTVNWRELTEWLQTAVGYSLTGHNREECLFYIHGPSRSGKGTFLETISKILGNPLSKGTEFSTFTRQRDGNDQGFDLAPLKSARLVFASENKKYERFNEAKIKQITGGDFVSCAFKKKDIFEYVPQYKIWLLSNNPVNMDPSDDAAWGRFRIVEFPHSNLGKEDKTIKAGFKSPASQEGILAWAVKGAQKWYKLGASGLRELESSKRAKEEIRLELDVVKQWLAECCNTSTPERWGNSDESARCLSDEWEANKELHISYKGWCEANGHKPKSGTGLTRDLKQKGFIPKLRKQSGKVVRAILGICLKPE